MPIVKCLLVASCSAFVLQVLSGTQWLAFQAKVPAECSLLVVDSNAKQSQYLLSEVAGNAVELSHEESFELSNVSGGPIRFEVMKASCGCMRFQCDGTPFSVGQWITLGVGEHKTLAVSSGLPKRPSSRVLRWIVSAAPSLDEKAESEQIFMASHFQVLRDVDVQPSAVTLPLPAEGRRPWNRRIVATVRSVSSDAPAKVRLDMAPPLGSLVEASITPRAPGISDGSGRLTTQLYDVELGPKSGKWEFDHALVSSSLFQLSIQIESESLLYGQATLPISIPSK